MTDLLKADNPRHNRGGYDDSVAGRHGLNCRSVIAHDIGFSLGLLKRTADEPFDRQIALVRTSTAALVAFLIAVCIFGRNNALHKSGRFHCEGSERARNCLLKSRRHSRASSQPTESCTKGVFRGQIALLSREGRDQIEPLLSKVSGLHERMWRSAITATQDNAVLMAVVLPPINEVIDLHSMHLAMARRHLPIPIMAVLLVTAAINVGIIGSATVVLAAAFRCSTLFMGPCLPPRCG